MSTQLLATLTAARYREQGRGAEILIGHIAGGVHSLGGAPANPFTICGSLPVQNNRGNAIPDANAIIGILPGFEFEAG